MNKPGATVSIGQDDEAELTTRQLLASHNRLKAGASLDGAAGNERSREDIPEPYRNVVPLAVRVALTENQLPARVDGENTRLGPYQIVCELASGGMATVYLALYRSVEGFEKLCAVKRIHPHLANDREFTSMFADEAQIAARISHPHVCSVFSFGRSQGHYIAMEFLRGEPLSAVMRAVARSPELGADPRFPVIAARLLANFAEGLHAAHTLRDDRGALFDVVHRDVTPQNLFVLYDGSVRVTDFGIARARRRLHQTEGQKLKGKLSYVAPEQLKGGNVDLRVDVWGLGVTLWELLAGRRLFLGASEGETLAAVTSRVVQPPSTFRANVPRELDRIVLRALERDVHARYRSARDLARDLERFLSSMGDQVPAMDVSDWMGLVFPQGGERIQALVELAARVSAATADDTVVRVPSAPPARGAFAATPVATVPKLPPTRVSPPSPEPREGARRESESHPSEPRPPQQSKPRLILVDETTGAGSPATPGPQVQLSAPVAPRREGRWFRVAAPASAGLLVVALVSLAMRGHESRAEPASNTRAAATPPLDSPLPQRTTAESPNLTGTHEVDEAPPVNVEALPVALELVQPAVPKPLLPARLGAAPQLTPSSVAPSTGVVFVTTPGGGGDVSERGRPLGHAPGTFRLGIGAHELSLRAPSGAVHTLHVDVQADAPTLVTVNGVQ